MTNNIFIAYRLIRSKKNKFFSLSTIIAIAGIALSITVLVLALEILDGFERTIFSSAAKIDSQVKITGYGNKNLDDNEKIVREIKSALGSKIIAVEKYVSKYAVIRGKTNSDGAAVTGIKGETSLSNLLKFVKGENSGLGKGKVILGKSLAEKLGVNVGDVITIFALKNDKIPDAENPPNIERFKVSGIFEIGMPYYDDTFAFVSFSDGQNLFGMQKQISGYNVYLKDVSEENIEQAAESLRKTLSYPYYPRSIFAVHRNIFVWLELQKKPIPIVLSAILIIASLNIIGALFLLVLKRRKTIGTLRTLGFTKKHIKKIFVFQGAVISFLGIFFGLALSALLTFLQNNFRLIELPGNIYFIDKLIIAWKMEYYVLVAFGAALIGLLASIIPAGFAAKISPISAIRGN